MPGIYGFWQIVLVYVGPVLSGTKMVFRILLPDEAPGVRESQWGLLVLDRSKTTQAGVFS